MARGEFNLATTHLDEARKLARKGGMPNACVHAAYYAMHHAAAAALLAAGGVGKRRNAPASHEHMIRHFAKLTVDEQGYLASAAEALNRARVRRTIADYGVIAGGATAEDAKQLAAEAASFVAACAHRWTLSAPNDAMERLALLRELEQLKLDP